MKKEIRNRALASTGKFPAVSFTPSTDAEERRSSATGPGVLSWRNLWNLLFFLLISVAAFSARDFNLFAAVPTEYWPLLGTPPPPQFIHLALVIYLFCGLTLLPDRLNRASLLQGWVHVGYRTAFYLFYLTANTLSAHFMVVFAAGLLLYGLEQSYLLLQQFKTLQASDAQINQGK